VNEALGELQALREELIRTTGREASEKLKLLLEGKHIYQSVFIEAKGLISTWMAKARSLGAIIQDGDADLEKDRFALADSQLEMVDRWGPADGTPVLTLSVPNAKLFCSACGDREVFSPVWYQDMANELNKPVVLPIARKSPSAGDGFQLFYITLQCQRCLGKPEDSLLGATAGD
jgi:hypothetical protein